MKKSKLSILVGLMALAFLINPYVAHAQNVPGCAWPIELSPEGYGNATGPESLARYFLIPFDTQYETMTIKGAYPHVRYFSFVVYLDETPSAVLDDHLYDALIAPDPGSVNPFVRPENRTSPITYQPVDGTYTVVISRTQPSAGNTIGLPKDENGDRFAWVMLRMYIPSADPSLGGQSLTGSVPLPKVILTQNGVGRELSACSPVNKLPDVFKLMKDLFKGIIRDGLVGGEGTPSSDRLWFAAPKVTPVRLLPNPDNKYIATLPGDNYQRGRVIVVHGKAPGTPNTYDGTPIWEPARTFRTVDMRYWSFCNVNLALPVTTVDCTSDLTTKLQDGYYTIVISDDLLRPEWLRPNVNWLPWGDENYPKLMFFRNMLPAPGFPYSIQNALSKEECTFNFQLPFIPNTDDTIIAGHCVQGVMGDYYPVAVWCDKSTFIHGGWQACINGR